MDEFQQYLENLPKNPTPKDREFLDDVMQPYVVSDAIDEKLHVECETVCPTRTFRVYVPLEDEYVQFDFHHVGSESSQMCDEFRQRRIERDYNPGLARIFLDFKNPFEKIDPYKRIEIAARLRKSIKVFNDLLPELVALSRNI